jgi:thiol-disulfide isomerase/thioredoxin
MSRLTAQGIEFFEGSWEEAVAKAKAEEKLIFVDAYASWCGPCKRMAKNVFPNDRVGEFYNKNFVALKWDMEKDPHGIKFRQKYPVNAFPTLYYIDFTGEVVQNVRGAQMVEQFIELGKKALLSVDRSGLYEADYEKGDRSPALVYNYVKALNKVGKPSQKITNDYLRSQDNLTSEENLKIIFEGTMEADSKAFELLVENRPAIEAIFGAENVQARIIDACRNTVKKAIEFGVPDLMYEAQKLAKANVPAQADAFAYRSEMDYAHTRRDSKTFLKAASGYLKKIAKDDAEAHSEIATVIANSFGSDPKAMKDAEEYAGRAAKLGESYEYYYSYAVILNQNGKKEDAIEAAKAAFEMVKDKDRASANLVQVFLRRLQEG